MKAVTVCWQRVLTVPELGVAFAKDTHEDLTVQLTQTLEDMKQDGTIGRVAEKFGLDAEKTVWGEQEK